MVEFRVKKSVTFGDVVQIDPKEVKREEVVEKGEKEEEELREMLCGGRRIGLAPEEVMDLMKEEEIGGGMGMESGYVASIKGLLGSFTGAIGGWRRSPS